MLTAAATRWGGTAARRLLHLDPFWLEDQAMPAGSEALLSPLKLIILNLQLAVTWLFLWVVAHVTMVIIGLVVLALHGIPARLVLAAEVFPAAMMTLFLSRAVAGLRLAVTVGRVVSRQGEVVERTPTLPSGLRFLLRLMRPSDADFVLVASLVAVLEFLY